ncbi:MAG TPA: DUF2778 domain-containing protein [Methylobacterium sp.]
MVQHPSPSGVLAAPHARHGLGRLTPALAALSGFVILGGLSLSSIMPPLAPAGSESERRRIVLASPAVPGDEGTPVLARSPEPATLEPQQSALLEPVAPSASEADAPPQTPFAEHSPAPSPESPPQEMALGPQLVPLPVPRPPELRGEPSRRADRSRRARAPEAPAAPAEEPSFFEKLFGIERSAAPALAFASLGGSAVDGAQRRQLVPVPSPMPSPLPSPEAGGGTAVYDIGARTVTLPSGERLEAHSGLGASMDDPRYVHLRMRGATPPGTYDLTEREQPFHGVRALRMHPVGGSAAIHGRTGILAHTYMLGPSGASNGCVSFKDYEKFLQAYLRGEVQRIVVVAGRIPDRPPLVAGRSAGPTKRSVRRAGSVRVASLP